MLKFDKELKNWIIFLTILVVSIVGLLFLGNYFVKQSSVKEIQEPIKVSLIIKTDNWNIEYKNVSTKNNTVYKLLLECSKNLNFTVKSKYWKVYNSVFIEEINGTKNGGGKWWQYYVNGEYGKVGCDLKELKDGDLVAWKFESAKQ